MRYLKVILTIIAILLTLHLIKPFFISTAHSYNTQDVNITSIAGMPLTSKIISVRVVD